MNRTSLKALVIGWMLVFGASRADAGSLTVGWTQTLASNVAGYMISYGTVPGQYTSSVKVGNLSSYVISGLGDGTVYYFIVQAYDGSGNLSDPLQEITAVSSGASTGTTTPTSAPVITCPAPQGTSTDGSPVVVTFAPDFSGGTAPLRASCSPASGSLFPVGTTPTTCTVTDAVQLTASCSTSVIVSYNPPTTATAPASSAPLAIMCPAPSATSITGGAVPVSFAPIVSGGTAPISSRCTPASGSLFPVGSTPLTCSATDAKLATASCTSSVTVIAASSSTTPTTGSSGGLTPLTISCPVIGPVISKNGTSVKVSFSPTVAGGVAPIVSSCAPSSGSSFPIGTTSVMCTATDAQRQTASCSTSVTVTDSNPGNGSHNGRPLATTVKESPGQ